MAVSQVERLKEFPHTVNVSSMVARQPPSKAVASQLLVVGRAGRWADAAIAGSFAFAGISHNRVIEPLRTQVVRIERPRRSDVRNVCAADARVGADAATSDTPRPAGRGGLPARQVVPIPGRIARSYAAVLARVPSHGPGEPQSAMSLPARQQRALDRIEQTLAADDPGLGSMFAIFTELAREEPMPTSERVCAWLKRLFRPAVVISIAVIAVLTVLMFSRPSHSRSRVTLAGVAGWPGQAWTVREAACPSRRILPDHSGKLPPAGGGHFGTR
jgi:hypothetical protein